MSLTWSIDKHARLVTVEGRGIVDRSFFATYLAGMNAEGCKAYRKLFNLTSAWFDISSDDIDVVVSDLVGFGAEGTAGPVAMVLNHTSPASVDMAVLLKQRIGITRPFRIFFTIEEALQWLENVKSLKFIPVPARGQTASARETEGSPAAEGDSAVTASPKNVALILVVDDDPGGRDAAAEHLTALGYRTLKASTGAEALELLTTGNQVDLLFTDVVMGGMTGQQLADIAVRLNPQLKVLFTSGYIGAALTSGGTLKPGAKVLVKPFRRRELAQAVEDAFT